MKKQLLLFAFAVMSIISQLQAQVNYASLKLEKKEDYTAEVNNAALQAATTLLQLPLQRDNPERVDAFAFLMRWMSGSPDFNFDIDETATAISKTNEDLLVVYLASMSQYVLQNREMAADKKAVKLHTVKAVLAYCQRQQVKLSGALKKMNKAHEAGELEKYLKG